MVKDPYKTIRRNIPPPDFKFGKEKYIKNKNEELHLIEEGLKEYFNKGDSSEKNK